MKVYSFLSGMNSNDGYIIKLGINLSLIQKLSGRNYRMSNTIIDLYPYFQPIVSMAGKNVYGFEILARGMDQNGNHLLPKDIFCSIDRKLYIERDQLVREKAFQIISDLKRKNNISSRFFFNIPPENLLTIRDIDTESHLVHLCEKYDVAPGNIVIEITERATDRFPDIVSLLSEYKKRGFIIAIDDWGAEHSNFDRLAMLMPDIVKFDANFLWRATNHPHISEIFSSAVSMISKLGMVVIAEGIETVENLYMALEAGCPLIQGFLLARPNPELDPFKKFNTFLDDAFRFYRDGKIRHMIREKNKIRSYVDTIHSDLEEFAGKVTDTDQLIERIQALLNRQKDIIKAYVLDPTGVQISPNYVRTNGSISLDPTKLDKDWSWRPYYLEALVNKELFNSKYTITGPYVDPDIGMSVFTVCIVLDRYMMCVDYKNEL